VIVAAARLAPIGQLLDRADVIDVYDEFCFGHQLDRLEDVPLLIDHDTAQRVGDVTRIFRRDGWWWAEMYIDTTKHRLGPIGVDMLTKHPRHPVSLGAEVHREQPAGLLDRARWIRIAELEEVSLTTRPAYPGARVELVIPTRTNPGRRTSSSAGAAPRTHLDELERADRTQLAKRRVLVRRCGEIIAVR
jgi:hypothetical protein